MVESLTTEIRQRVAAGSSPVDVEVEELFKYPISRADGDKFLAYAFDPPSLETAVKNGALVFTIFLLP